MAFQNSVACFCQCGKNAWTSMLTSLLIFVAHTSGFWFCAHNLTSSCVDDFYLRALNSPVFLYRAYLTAMTLDAEFWWKTYQAMGSYYQAMKESPQLLVMAALASSCNLAAPYDGPNFKHYPPNSVKIICCIKDIFITRVLTARDRYAMFTALINVIVKISVLTCLWFWNALCS
jgi:hypothetical protein